MLAWPFLCLNPHVHRHCAQVDLPHRDLSDPLVQKRCSEALALMKSAWQRADSLARGRARREPWCWRTPWCMVKGPDARRGSLRKSNAHSSSRETVYLILSCRYMAYIQPVFRCSSKMLLNQGKRINLSFLAHKIITNDCLMNQSGWIRRGQLLTLRLLIDHWSQKSRSLFTNTFNW